KRESALAPDASVAQNALQHGDATTAAVTNAAYDSMPPFAGYDGNGDSAESDVIGHGADRRSDVLDDGNGETDHLHSLHVHRSGHSHHHMLTVDTPEKTQNGHMAMFDQSMCSMCDQPRSVICGSSEIP